MNKWFVVQTQPRNEPRAAFNLKRQGFEIFLPEFLKTRRHARKTELVRRPFFPGYMFVRFDPSSTPWRAINSTFGVIGLVALGENTPTPIPDKVVETLLERRGDDGTLIFNPVERIKEGDKIRINDGPFADLDAVFVMQNDKDRVTVLLNLMGRMIRVLTPSRTVEAFA